MKIRNGFVSNSSSSSFICDKCGESFEGYDGDYGDIDHLCCEYDHGFCSDCMTANKMDLNDKQVELLRDMLLESLEGNDQDLIAQATTDPVQYIKNEWYDLVSFLKDIGEDWAVPEAFCPCCSTFDLPNRDLVQYFLWSNMITKDQLKQKIRNTFRSYKEFKRYVTGITSASNS